MLKRDASNSPDSEWQTEVSRGERFRFGENWKAYAEGIDEAKLAAAEAELKTMLGVQTLAGKRLLDIGCGSGVHAVAAARMGASVTALDFDVDSVECTSRVLGRYAAGHDFRVVRGSVLDAAFMRSLGTYDVVYSWGVLHHTGGLLVALENASAAVSSAPGSIFAIALYSRTMFDALWIREKALYAAAPPSVQWTIRKLWMSKTRLSFFVRRKSYSKMVADYGGARGMDFERDAHDWLGGYPYEPINPSEVLALVVPKGFQLPWLNCVDRTFGLSSGCDEYRFVRG
jgi:2-polyprenyl-6-hydroxyphenyl methylase/3-demethylubiquinone-9 3-methyltransferase